MMSSTWTICRLMDEYEKTLRNNEKLKDADLHIYYENEEKIKNLYAQAMRLQCREGQYGDIFTKESFQRSVDSGGFTSYDGSGEYLGWDGNELGPCDFDIKRIKKSKAVFVAWYNS